MRRGSITVGRLYEKYSKNTTTESVNITGESVEEPLSVNICRSTNGL